MKPDRSSVCSLRRKDLPNLLEKIRTKTRYKGHKVPHQPRKRRSHDQMQRHRQANTAGDEGKRSQSLKEQEGPPRKRTEEGSRHEEVTNARVRQPTQSKAGIVPLDTAPCTTCPHRLPGPPPDVLHSHVSHNAAWPRRSQPKLHINIYPKLHRNICSQSMTIAPNPGPPPWHCKQKQPRAT